MRLADWYLSVSAFEVLDLAGKHFVCIHSFIHSFIRLFAFSRTAPAAYGGSQARGLIGAVATGLHQSHSNVGSKLCL